MRLKWGPHASETVEQVVLRDPFYVTTILAGQPAGALSALFRDRIMRFDALPLALRCARCGGRSDRACAYLGSVALIGSRRRCASLFSSAVPAFAHDVTSYEGALRHVVASFPRGHRLHMRRIIGALVLAKSGPSRLTEAAAHAFLTTWERGADG